SSYLHGAIQKYKWMTILGGDEVELDEYYVCNRIGRSPAVIAYLDKGNTIDEATLKQLRTYDRRGITNRVILIAASGFGKTLMLQHLFLQAARTQADSGLLPVLVELRNFSHISHDLVACIVASVARFGEKFTEDDARDLLAKGQCQILLDGLDEMDPSEITEFQRNLTDFIDLYPDNQIVLSSRECDALNGIRRFNKLYIHPFDNDQSQRLIDKLLQNVDDPRAKGKIQRYMDEGFIKKDGLFATNPMLLTFVVQNYQKLDEYSQSRYLFYQEVYDAMLVDHDADKNAFDRIFHSVSNVDEFTRVFREFCALSYLNAEREFSKASFENYFNKLQSVNEVDNPSKLKWRSFLQDACATACMMYEASSKIIYIDPAFQEYLFALYMYQAPIERARELLKPLKNKSPMEYKTLNGFHMLYEMGAEKAEIAFFLPFLDLIFRGSTEDEAFEKYLQLGYSEIGITVLDKEKVIRLKFDENRYVTYVNEPSCIPMLFVLREKQFQETFVTGTYDPRLWWEDSSIYEITMDAKVVGHIVKITQDVLSENADKRHILAEMLRRDDPELYSTFRKVREYHAQIAAKRRALTQTEVREDDS
ncbi:MAG: NACHT domain-containing protein, partial [Clostridia bacterium]|nr:NACHT domain-containing protein [Clostridia bacterium]